VNLHLLSRPVSDLGATTLNSQKCTYHLEGVQLLLDLLSQHRCQAVARSNLAPTVILLTRPRLKKDNPGTKSRIALHASLGGSGAALGVLAKSEGCEKVILAANCYCSGPPVLRLLVGGARRARTGRVGDVG
jgi:hypothetical protein